MSADASSALPPAAVISSTTALRVGRSRRGDDHRPAPRKLQRDRSPDAARRASDNRHVAVELSHDDAATPRPRI